ncbi:MAG: hypothetical protein ACKVT2_04830 [Saprospiraceae bacterium]
MFRLFLSLFIIALFINSAEAQSNPTASSRLTFQDLSPSESQHLKETNEVNDFGRYLAALKIALAEKNTSQIIANESYLLLAMRMEADQLSGKIANSTESNPTTEAAKTRVEKMKTTLLAFNSHTFDPDQPEATTRDLAKLDEFLKIMQEELKAAGN